MQSLEQVYVVHYVVELDAGEESLLIGVFSSKKTAEEAVNKLINRNGFRNNPKIHYSNSPHKYEEGGFFISLYKLDLIHWEEGFSIED